MFNIFEFSSVKEIAESLVVSANRLSSMIQSYFLTETKKTKLMPASFSYFLELLCEKKVTLSSVIVITVIISLHYKETD